MCSGKWSPEKYVLDDSLNVTRIGGQRGSRSTKWKNVALFTHVLLLLGLSTHKKLAPPLFVAYFFSLSRLFEVLELSFRFVSLCTFLRFELECVNKRTQWLIALKMCSKRQKWTKMKWNELSNILHIISFYFSRFEHTFMINYSLFVIFKGRGQAQRANAPFHRYVTKQSSVRLARWYLRRRSVTSSGTCWRQRHLVNVTTS